MALFEPFRALGYVSDAVPFDIIRRGKQSFVIVSVGKAWQMYNCAKLHLVFVGPQLRHNIRALASRGDFTYAASGSDIVVSRRAHQIGVWSGHTKHVKSMLTFGDYLLSLGEDHQLNVWSHDDFDAPVTSIALETSFQPTCLLHPDTYINKVVIGSEDGRLQLWNVKTGKLIFTFKGWGVGVKCLVGTPALDVVAVGLADGRIVVHNLRYDTTIVSFVHDTGGGAVTGLALRTGAGLPLLAAGGASGLLTVWNLEKRKLHGVIKDAHDGPITALHFFPDQPVLLSGAADNTLKQWIFDEPGATPRLLKFRAGHGAPPTCIGHYGSGKHILSAGQDRAFRVFSTIRDQQSRELSQGHTAKKAKKMKVREEEVKLSRVTAFASCQTRERDWCNVITSHENDPCAYVWHLSRGAIGKHVLKPTAGPQTAATVPSTVTSVCITPCGNFGIVGTSAGTIHKYNMQSGLHRGAYKRGDKSAAAAAAPSLAGQWSVGGKAWAQQEEAGLDAHEAVVAGLAVDACNRMLVSAGADRCVRVWDLAARQLQDCIRTEQPVTHMDLHAATGLLAVALTSMAVEVYDVVALRRVRVFKGHTDRITALQVSADARWVVSASMDGTVRVSDIPSARLVQAMNMGPAVTSLSLSPHMDMLATAHVGRKGIYLWTNRALYLGLLEANLLPASKEEVVDVRMPTISDMVSKGGPDGEEEDGIEGEASSEDEEEEAEDAEEDDEEEEEEEEDEETRSSKKRKLEAGPSGAERLAADERGAAAVAPGLVTMSLLPRTQWKALLNIEAIRQRNKPKAPPKKPERAPFFLPTLASLSGTPVFATEDQEDGEESKSRFVHRGSAGSALSEFVARLRGGAASGDFTRLIAHLRALSPSAVDLELQSLAFSSPNPEETPEEDVELLGQVLLFADAELRTNRNFELVQSFLHRFLELHGEIIAAHPGLRTRARTLKLHLAQTWGKVDNLMQEVRCMMGFFTAGSAQ